ncbi:MAG: T9SS type A sorting domain-containing protein [Cytophagaceae bacterium]|nr:T9SS type A sorting domain-containing protein [Cytophagaceae bacterium]
MKKILLNALAMMLIIQSSFAQVFTYTGGDPSPFGAAGWPMACSSAPAFTQDGSSVKINVNIPASASCDYKSFAFNLGASAPVNVTGQETVYIVAKASSPIKLRVDMQSADDPTAGLTRTTDSEAGTNVSGNLTTSYAVYTFTYPVFMQQYGGSNNGAVDKTKITNLLIYPGTGEGTPIAFNGTINIKYIQIGGSAPTCTTPASANAGLDQTVCSNSTVSLSGIGTGSLMWLSGGLGTFTPDNSSASVTYTPTTADTANGSVYIKLVAQGIGPACAEAEDLMLVTFVRRPTVNAGADQIICNNATATMAGVKTNSPTGTWSSSGTGTFTPDNTTLNATYNPSAADKIAGNVTLTLTATGNTPCANVTDNMALTINTCTGITNSSQDKFNIYPNPAHDKIMIENNSSQPIINVKITNAEGQLILNQNGDLETIDLGKFHKGIYFIKLETADGSLIKKLVIE